MNWEQKKLPNQQSAVIEGGYIGVLGVTHISFMLFNNFKGSRVVKNNKKLLQKLAWFCG